jgi:hypothetical protein
MSPRIICLLVAGLLVRQIVAQDRSIGFLDLEVPPLKIEKNSPIVPQAANYLDNATAFGISILEANRLEGEHRVDFIVLSVDFVPFGSDPAASASELARTLHGLTVHRILVLAGPCLRSPATRKAYGQFIAALKQNLPRHDVSDLTGQTLQAGDFTLVGLDTGILASSNPPDLDKEVSRAAGAVARGSAALLFASIESLPKTPLEAKSLFQSPAWPKLVAEERLAGIFVSALGDVPQNGPLFPAPGKEPEGGKLHITPRLSSAAKAPARGLLFARAGRDARATSDPIWISWNGPGLRDQENVLIEAQLLEKNGEYEEANKKYGAAIKSKDQHIQAFAEAGFRRTDEALQSWWEKWKAKSQFVRLAAERWRDALIAIAFLIVAGLLVFVRYWAHGPARIELPKKLSVDAPAELFMFHVIDAVRTRRQSSAAWRSLAEETGTREFEITLDLAPGVAQNIARPKIDVDVNFAPDAAQSIADELGEVEVPGLDLKAVAKLLKWVLSVVNYFSWKVEVSLWGTESQCIAYARLRFGPVTEFAWMQPTSVTGPMTPSAAAWQLVCDVIDSGVRIR